MSERRFADCTLDTGRRMLVRAGEPVRLAPKTYQLLELLISRRPDAVSKEELQEALWPSVVVTEASLTTLVKELRRALGEKGGEAAIVRTVFGFGYAFEAAVREVPARPRSSEGHLLRWRRYAIELPEGASLLGRERTADVWVPDASVSREHARLVVSGPRAEVEDLGSKNGTLRNGRPLSARETLENGDELRVGTVVLTYQRGAGGELTESSP